MLLAASSNEFDIMVELISSVFDRINADTFEIAGSIIIVVAVLVAISLAVDIINKV